MQKFDGYKGQQCRTDLEKVMRQLQSIYGIELSEDRVIWENPDRLSTIACPSSQGQEVKK